MAMHSCNQCSIKAQHDTDPNSFLGRIWKWHIKYCPGWKKYITSLSTVERVRHAEKYKIKKYK